MIGMIEFSGLVLIIGIATDLVLNINFFFTGLGTAKKLEPEKGPISILVATRNEEKNITNCLESLLNQNCQPGIIEILVGDDDSLDGTLEIARHLARVSPTVEVYPIRETLGNASGKGNVIAHLTKKTNSNVLCITDADMTHSVDWVSSVASRLTAGVGICIGATAVSGSWLGARLQNLDWLLAQGMIQVATSLNFPVTALGNNMAITREAYDSTGGLENLPHTVTEDFQMFRHIQKQGYQLVVDMSPGALCFTEPVTDLTAWLQQRKRWAFGAIRIHWLPLSLLIINTLLFPLALLLLFFHPWISIGLILARYLLQGLFLHQIHNRLSLTFNFYDYIAFQTLSLIGGFLVAVYCLLPGRIYWKGREYSFW